VDEGTSGKVRKWGRRRRRRRRDKSRGYKHIDDV
jgi:hypothetical protein